MSAIVDSQLYCYFCAAITLRTSASPQSVEAARANLRGLAHHCGTRSIADAASNCLESCGFPDGNYAQRFRDPKGVA